MPHAESSSPTQIDHTGFVVPDLAEATAFFTEHLGAAVAFSLGPIEDPSGESAARIGARRGATFALTMLTVGSARVELLQWWPCLGEAPSAPNVAGASHLALEVADAGAFVAHLRTVAGVEVLSEPLTFDDGPTPGMTNAFVRTPWGLLIEVVSWSTQPSS